MMVCCIKSTGAVRTQGLWFGEDPAFSHFVHEKAQNIPDDRSSSDQLAAPPSRRRQKKAEQKGMVTP
jgi:hypothetical protein